MNAEFQWWLLIVGIALGVVVAWLVLADSARRERDIADEELPPEAAWISRTLADEGVAIDPPTAEAVLLAHRRYLGFPPPDAYVDAATFDAATLDAPAEARVEPGVETGSQSKAADSEVDAPPTADAPSTRWPDEAANPPRSRDEPQPPLRATPRPTADRPRGGS